MRMAKKSICVVLSLLMLFSICLVPSLAAGEPLPSGNEDSAKINVKYEVEQVASAYDMLNAVDNNLYAVTIYAKAVYGINVLQVPLHYDKTKFSPIMWADDDPVTNGALGTDGWYEANSDDSIYDYGKGQAWNETTMLRANGNTASNLAQATYVPLGSTSASLMGNRVTFVDSTNPAYATFSKGLPDNAGVMYYYFNNSTNKMAYLNAYQNKLVADWVSVATIYFMRNEGVSEEDAAGATFGFTVAGAYGTQGGWDTCGEARYLTNFVNGEPGVNYVANAVVTASAAAPALKHAGRQVKMNVVDGKVVKGTEQLRVVSSISNEDWDNYFANTTNEAESTNKLLEVGIVATQGAFDMTAAQDAAKLGKGVHGDYTVATTTYIQNTGSDYRFGARIEYQTNVFDTTYVAFAKYLNAKGAEAYVFYDASYALAFAKDYGKITQDYINFLNNQAA